MRVFVHQAIYGAAGSSHSLLVKSNSENVPFSELKGQTDRFGVPPPNVVWDPYISGYAFKDYYIVAKTFPDETATRSGMVFTHALVARTQEITKISDLDQLVELLFTSPIKVTSLPILSLDTTTTNTAIKESPPTGLPGLTKVVNELINKKDPQRPVVWIGQEGFIEIVAALWRNLWPEARERFAFRFAFSPQDVEGHHDLTLIATLSKLSNRWVSFQTVSPQDTHIPESMAESLLLGLPSGASLREFMIDLGMSLQQPSDLRVVEQCYELIQAAEVSADADEVRALVRLLVRLSPSPDYGMRIKVDALNKLATLTKGGDAAGIMALRNLDVTPITGGEKIIAEAITSWVETNLQSSKEQDCRENSRLLMTAFSNPGGLWADTILKAANALLARWKPDISLTMWRWWKEYEELVDYLADVIPKRTEIQSKLVRKVPDTLEQSLGGEISDFAKGRRWLVLHAAVVSIYLEPAEAIRAQLEIDKESDYLAGLREISNRIPNTKLLENALEIGEERILRIIGEMCAKDTGLLEKLDVGQKEWRRIWLYATKAGCDPWEGVANPSRIVRSLINLVLNDEDVDDELLIISASSPYGDLTDHPKRKNVWRNLKSPLAYSFLETPAEGWLKRFKQDPDFDKDIEPTLEESVLESSRLATHLTPGQVSFAINLFSHFERLSEAQFSKWLMENLGSRVRFNRIDATRLGSLVVNRRWTDTAKIICRAVEHSHRDDLLPALHECYGMLGLITSIRLRFYGILQEQPITWDEWWRAFTDILIELYPRGPEDQRLWERSGGKTSVLNMNQSGRRAWEEAMHKVRYGGAGKKINTGTLMWHMREDFSQNETLKMIHELGESLSHYKR